VVVTAAGGDLVSVAGHQVRVTNLDKVLYPSTGTTKADVLQYYLGVAPRILAELRDRPVTRKRWPDGVDHEPFIEKNLPRGTPEWVPRMTQHHTGERSGRPPRDLDYPLVDDEAVLVWLAQSGALELHAPQWRADRATGEALPPDRLVVDLDPGAPAGLDACAEVAIAARDLIAADGLAARAVTSGSKGLQLYADLGELDGAAQPAPAGAESVSAYALRLAGALETALPDLVVTRQARELRPGRVLVDWSQNNPAKTTIVPWSLRGKEVPTAATPVTWAEVEAGGLTQRSLQESLALATDLG
jgi:bifunctional non-homologous end joining protein LigD